LSRNRLVGAMALPPRSTACHQPTVGGGGGARNVWPGE
jgi:hypothetical protein